MLGRGTVTIIMRMNRRNVLVGLGTIVAGGGGALATGAFSQVQAERTIAVETTGDEGAYLGLTANNTNIASSSSTSQLTLTINQLNENALTEFEGVFTITNNGNDPVGITIEELDSGEAQLVIVHSLGKQIPTLKIWRLHQQRTMMIIIQERRAVVVRLI